MNKITKLSLNTIMVAMLAVGTVHADDDKEDGKAPLGCINTGYRFDLRTLHLMPGIDGEKQAMYFLYNNSNQTVNLFQMRNEESSRSTYMNHSVGSHQWAVLSTSEKEVKFVCTVPKAKSEYGEMVDCGENLKVCEFAKVRYGLNNRGNYWLVNSGTKKGAIREVVHYGIIPQ